MAPFLRSLLLRKSPEEDVDELLRCSSIDFTEDMIDEADKLSVIALSVGTCQRQQQQQHNIIIISLGILIAFNFFFSHQIV